jgi:DNA-binding beta-propeller fold protein YncE
LVTDETQNLVLGVDLASGRVVQRVKLPPDPEDIATSQTRGLVIVVSSRAGVVTLLDGRSLRPLKILAGFDRPHIAAVSPDGQHAYITDDVRGTLTAISLADMRITSTIAVGSGAHHLTFSPDQRRVWVALGESASRIVILDTTDLNRPRLIGAFNPGFLAHDLSFSPNGRQVWVGSASGSDVSAFSAQDHRVLFRVPVGPPPQHIVFQGRFGYLTSGYGSTIERVDIGTRRILERVASPYGSFELAAGDGYVVTASLLSGTLAIYSPALQLRRRVRLAPESREVAILSP